MIARQVSGPVVEEVVHAVRSERLDPKVLGQADRALAVLRSYGWSELEKLLSRDLPRTMNRSHEWKTFRREIGPKLRKLHGTWGDSAVELYLAWLARRAKTDARSSSGKLTPARRRR